MTAERNEWGMIIGTPAPVCAVCGESAPTRADGVTYTGAPVHRWGPTTHAFTIAPTAEPAPHWHVANGTPGYLFDTEPPLPTFDSRREAYAYALAEAREVRDDRNDGASWRLANGAGRLRVPLARVDRWTLGTRGHRPTVGRTGPFSISIDRRHNPYSLPYEWQAWPCTDTHDEEGN